MARRLFHLSFALERASMKLADGAQPATAPDNANEFLVTMLVGDGTYNGLFVPSDELARAAPSMDRQPLNINHSDQVEDEVGFVRNPQMFERALKGVLVLNPATAKFSTARAYIANRFAAGNPPEVSVGFYCDVEENNEGLLIARNITFDHLALVTRGACSPADGCGVGMARQKVTHMEPNANPAPEAKAPEAKPEEQKQAEGAAAAPAAPEAKPCGCAALKVRVEALESDKKSLTERLTVYESRELAALTSEAHKLGVPTDASDGIPCLQKKLALARSVREQALKDAESDKTPVRHTAAGSADVSVASTSDAEVRKLARLGGIEF